MHSGEPWFLRGGFFLGWEGPAVVVGWEAETERGGLACLLATSQILACLLALGTSAWGKGKVGIAISLFQVDGLGVCVGGIFLRQACTSTVGEWTKGVGNLMTATGRDRVG